MFVHVDPIVKTLHWNHEDQTMAFAQGLAQHLLASDSFHTLYIELKGPLGSGKTTLVRHLLRALGVEGRIKSPTYAVLETYNPKGFPIFHFDFYRFADPREWEDAGFRDVFGGAGLKLAEWPEQAAGLLPTADLTLSLRTLDQEIREVELTAATPKGQELYKLWQPQ